METAASSPRLYTQPPVISPVQSCDFNNELTELKKKLSKPGSEAVCLLTHIPLSLGLSGLIKGQQHHTENN